MTLTSAPGNATIPETEMRRINVEELLTTRQVAELLNLTERRVRQLIDGGQLKAVRIGRDWLVSRVEAERYQKVREDNR